MKRFLGVTVAIAVFGALFAPHTVLAAGNPSGTRPGNSATAPGRTVADAAKARKVPGEIIVRYASGADRAEVRNETGAEVVERLALPRSEVVKTDPADVAATIAALEASPDVLFAEPNYYWRAAATPNDPKFGSNWGLNNTGQSVAGVTGTADADIDAPEAWEGTTGSRNVVVAVADSGVAADHPDLAANMWHNPAESGGGKDANARDDDDNGKVDDWRGWDFIDNDNDPRDLLGHGTHVAGTVGAVGNDGYGTSGVAWNVSLMPLRVLGADGSGSTAHVTNAIAYAAKNGADIINLSLGGPDYSTSVNAAIAAAPELLVVTAAGNEAQNIDVLPSYPCNYASSNIICVGASDQNDALAGYSNYGAVNVDLVAPGSRILSPVPAFVRPLREQFETDIAMRWVAGGTGAQWGRELDAAGYFGTDSPAENYQANSDTWLQTVAPIDLTGLNNCNLSYVVNLDTESRGDFFTAEASSDATTWAPLGKALSGSTGGQWISRSDSMTLAGSVYIRFRLTSNALIEKNGVSVDDVQVRCLTSNYVGNEFSLYSGTSMATPHVAGAAALVMSAAPDASLATVKSALLSGVDAKDAFFGKANTSGRLNVANALQVVLPNDLPPLPGGETSPSPKPTPSETKSPAPDASPTPEATPTPDATPTPQPTTEAPTIELARQVGLRLSKHLRVSGQVMNADDISECIAAVPVKIKRNGVLVKTITTYGSGAFATKLRDRAGRYVAIVPAVGLVTGETCAAAKSPLRRHRH